MLAKMIKWKGTKLRLVERIRAVSQLTKFSVREMKKLRRIIKKEYKGKDIDYEKLVYEFPGKSLTQLKKECNAIQKPQKRSRRKRY